MIRASQRTARLELSRETHGHVSRWPNRVPGKQSAEINHIQNVIQVLGIGLKAHIQVV
jgi:hypothetical protein